MVQLSYEPVTPRRFRVPRSIIVSVVVVIGLIWAAAVALQPHLISVRPTANRVKCAANLRQIGNALQLYAADHGGAYPDQLSELIQSEGLTSAVFVCPSSSAEASAATMPTQVANDLADPTYCSYVYLKENIGKADKAVVYERLDDHDGEGMNVLKGDFSGVDFFVARSADHSVLHDMGVPSADLVPSKK